MNRKILLVLLILFSIFSIAVISPWASKPETYRGTIKMLNEKQKNVLEMTTAAATASLALAAVPGDATTPIAEKIVDMAGYFIIILSVIILEKYMLTMAGYLTFTWLFPAACILFGVSLFFHNRLMQRIAVKITALGLALILIVPVSVRLTRIIEKANESSINTTMDNIKEIEKEAEATTEEVKEPENEEEAPMESIFGIKSKVDDLVEDTKETIKKSASAVGQLSKEAIEKAKNTMNDFVEVVVIMLVTSCGIPILTLAFFVWIIKLVLGVDMEQLLRKREER